MCRLKNDCIRTRLPIQRGMLAVLIGKIAEIYINQPYLSVLYRMLISTMYFGLFRISEMTSGALPVKACNVHIGSNKKKFLFVLHTSKTHGRNSASQMVKISSSKIRSQQRIKTRPSNHIDVPCPYELLHTYSRLRGGFILPTEPFFVFSDRSPVTPRHLSICLKTVLHSAGFQENLYGTQSLRVGQTCDLFKLRLSVETIKKLGRWKSNAVFRYLCT